MPESDLRKGHELYAGFLAGNRGHFDAERALQDLVHVRLVLEDKARRAAGGGDLRCHRFLGVRPANGALYGADAALLNQLGVTAELATGEVLGVDPTAAFAVELIAPLLQSQRERRANGLGMRHAKNELLLGQRRAHRHHRYKRGTDLHQRAPVDDREVCWV